MAEGQKTAFISTSVRAGPCSPPFAKGRRVLDLHCYTGAFALAAARAGAAEVKAVDGSGPAVELARLNAAENGLGGVVFEEGDAERALARAAAAPASARPNMILLDPPGLVPAKSTCPRPFGPMSGSTPPRFRFWSREGLLATSTCSHHVSREAFLDILRHAQAKSGRRARILALRGQGGDHPVLLAMPETEYLHFALPGGAVMEADTSRKFSPSKLDTYKNCPRRYQYRYVDRIDRRERSAEAFVGTMVHAVLEDLYENLRREGRRRWSRRLRLSSATGTRTGAKTSSSGTKRPARRTTGKSGAPA